MNFKLAVSKMVFEPSNDVRFFLSPQRVCRLFYMAHARIGTNKIFPFWESRIRLRFVVSHLAMTEWVKSVAGRYFGSSEEASGSTKQQHPSKDITEG